MNWVQKDLCLVVCGFLYLLQAFDIDWPYLIWFAISLSLSLCFCLIFVCFVYSFKGIAIQYSHVKKLCVASLGSSLLSLPIGWYVIGVFFVCGDSKSPFSFNYQ